jgi:hypothetical protein
MSGRGAPAWAHVKLRVSSGEVPAFSDILVMPTGRRYQVIGVRGRGLDVIVLPPEAPVGDARLWDWRWAKRTNKTPRPPGRYATSKG